MTGVRRDSTPELLGGFENARERKSDRDRDSTLDSNALREADDRNMGNSGGSAPVRRMSEEAESCRAKAKRSVWRSIANRSLAGTLRQRGVVGRLPGVLGGVTPRDE